MSGRRNIRLQNAGRVKINGHAVSINKLKVDGYGASLAVVVRMYLGIVSVDAAFGILLDCRRERCMVIGRSTVEGFDVGFIMRSTGGVGHSNAGSALLKSVGFQSSILKGQIFMA